MLNSTWEIQSYLPHSGNMVLIDRVIDYGAEFIVTELDVSPRIPCFANDQVPSYFGIEVMAQSIAAWSGIRRNDPGTRPPIGFLLGTRRFRCQLSCFEIGDVLKVRATQILENEGLAMFNCALDVCSKGKLKVDVAAANISVYSAGENSSEPVKPERSGGQS